MTPLRVLIVDDKERWAKMFRENLETVLAAELAGGDYEGYKFTFARDQQEANQVVAEAGPTGFDLVFLDLLYPLVKGDPVDEEQPTEFQGMKWLPELRGLLPGATIIILTSYAETEHWQNVVTAIRDHKADDFIPKTTPFEEWVPRIRLAHDTARRMRQLLTVEREFVSIMRTRAARSQTYAEDVASLLGRAKTALYRVAQRVESGDATAIASAPNTIRSEFEGLSGEFEELTCVLNKGQESLAQVDVAEETRLMTLLYRRMIDEAQVQVSVPDEAQSLRLTTYKDDLKVALHEVVTNALDALSRDARPGRRRLLEVKVWGAEGGAVIRVADNGPGFSDEAMAHMFERGFTTRDGKQESLGRHQGLGLYIAKRMMNQIGGEIEPRNNPEGGAEVSLFVKNLGDM